MSENLKPSGTDYLSEIPNTWDAKRIKFCAEICNGSEYADIVVDEGGFPVMGSGGEFARASKYCYTEKSVLLGRKGTIDKPLFIEEPFWCVDTMFYTKMKKGINAKYLYYCSLNIRFDFYVTSTALPSMTQRDLGSEKIAIPPLREQVVIADFLDKQCEKIDSIATNLEKQIDLLQKYKKSLITETVTKGLDKSVPMKDSGIEWIGDIPEYWDIKRIKYISSVHSSKRIFEEEYTDIGIPFFRTKEIAELANDKEISLELFISEKRFAQLKYNGVRKNDILVTSIGTIGEVWVSDGRDFYYKDGNITQIDGNSNFNSNFLKWELISTVFFDAIKFYESTTTISALTIEKIKEIYLPIPKNINEQIEISNYLEEQCSKIDSIIESKKEQLTKITQHKKSLIYEYVTGKKRVKGAHSNGN